MGLREELEKRLAGGKFRLANEELGRDPRGVLCGALAGAYHDAFRRQARRWRERPVDWVRQRLGDAELVADVGCGEAELAQMLPHVVSLDLRPVRAGGVECDMAALPLRDGCVDAAVFCLSLMAEDAAGALREGNRVLRHGGRLLVAEAAGRVADVAALVAAIEAMGFAATERHANGHFVLLAFAKRGDTRGRHCVALRRCVYKKR